MEEHGYIKVNLQKLINEKGLSKSKLAHKAYMERTQLNNWINNNISSYDADVLSRLCNALNCKVEDILEYVPRSEE